MRPASASEIASIVRDALLTDNLEAARCAAAEHPRVTLDVGGQPGLMLAIYDGPSWTYAGMHREPVGVTILGTLEIAYEDLPPPLEDGSMKLDLTFKCDRAGWVLGVRPPR